MQLPDFSEFLASINQEEYAKRVDMMNAPHIIQFNGNDPEAVSKVVTMIYQECLMNASKLSMLNLQAYHEWLQRQLE